MTKREWTWFWLIIAFAVLAILLSPVESQGTGTCTSQQGNSLIFESGDAWCSYTGNNGGMHVMIDDVPCNYYELRGKGDNLPSVAGGGKLTYKQWNIEGFGVWKKLEIWHVVGYDSGNKTHLWEKFMDVNPRRLVCRWRSRDSIQAIDVKDDEGNYKPWVDINELHEGLINPDTDYRIYVKNDKGIVVYGYDGNAWLAANVTMETLLNLEPTTQDNVLLAESADGKVKIFQHPNGWFSVLIGPLDEYGKMKSYQFREVPMRTLCAYEYRQEDPDGTWTQVQDCITYQ